MSSRTMRMVGVLASVLAVPVFAGAPAGEWQTANGDFQAGSWAQVLVNGTEGAPGNEWQIEGEGYSLTAVITETVAGESGFGFVRYLTTCDSGLLTLDNTEGFPWHNPADPATAFTFDLSTVTLSLQKMTDPMGNPTGFLLFGLAAEGAAADDPAVTASFEASYAGAPGTDTTVEPPFLFGALSGAALTVTAATEPDPVALTVDIKPGSDANPVNLTARGVIPVAILGSAEMDVSQIDPASLLLEGVAPVRWTIGDVPVEGSETGDGFPDLLLKVKTRALAAVLPAAARNQRVELTLTATLLDGTPAEGRDTIRVLRNNGRNSTGNGNGNGNGRGNGR